MVVVVEVEREEEEEEEENGTREIGSTVSCSAQLGSAQRFVSDLSPRVSSRRNRSSNFSLSALSSLPLPLSRLRPPRFRRPAEKGRVPAEE